MTKKKNGFWTFCFSFIPGAGQMYMGFMKMGISLMVLCFLPFYCAIEFSMEGLLLIDVVIWFYSFFHVHNLRAMDDEEFYALEDTFLFHVSEVQDFPLDIAKKYQKIIGAGLIFWGASMLWKNIWDMAAYLLPELLRRLINNLTYRLPQMVLAAVIIWLGVVMIRGKKRELYEESRVEQGLFVEASEKKTAEGEE